MKRALRFTEARSRDSHGVELRAPTGSGSCQSQCNPVRISPWFIMESWQPSLPQLPGGTLSCRLGREGRWGR